MSCLLAEYWGWYPVHPSPVYSGRLCLRLGAAQTPLECRRLGDPEREEQQQLLSQRPLTWIAEHLRQIYSDRKCPWWILSALSLPMEQIFTRAPADTHPQQQGRVLLLPAHCFLFGFHTPISLDGSLCQRWAHSWPRVSSWWRNKQQTSPLVHVESPAACFHPLEWLCGCDTERIYAATSSKLMDAAGQLL